MKSDDYVKYLTEQFVQYMNQPRDFRKQVRADRKQYKSSFKNELFGLLPDAISHTVSKNPARRFVQAIKSRKLNASEKEEEKNQM